MILSPLCLSHPSPIATQHHHVYVYEMLWNETKTRAYIYNIQSMTAEYSIIFLH